MQRLAAVLIMAGGLAFLASLYVPSAADREEQLAAMTRIVARATILEPETVPAELPGLRRPVTSPGPIAGPATLPAAPPAAIAPVEIETAAARPYPPASVDIQRRLAREIQAELKRVGCYTGRLDGSWGERSRTAMMTFIERVNASLPTSEPDVFLLSLIKGQAHPVCGPTCERNERLETGRCVSRTVVASAESPAPAPVMPPPAIPKAVPSPEYAAARPSPLPGRMSIGGPTLETPLVARPVVPGAEELPWSTPTQKQPARDVAELDQSEPDRAPDVRTPPPSRKVTKVKRTWDPPPSRPKPSKRRYSTKRQVQMLFMHPLGRM